jgi:hypothetical protein
MSEPKTTALPVEPTRGMIIAALEASLAFNRERGVDQTNPDDEGGAPAEMVRVVWRAMRAKLIEECDNA